MTIIERSFKTIRTKSISAHDLLLAYESLLNALEEHINRIATINQPVFDFNNQ